MSTLSVFFDALLLHRQKIATRQRQFCNRHVVRNVFTTTPVKMIAQQWTQQEKQPPILLLWNLDQLITTTSKRQFSTDTDRRYKLQDGITRIPKPAISTTTNKEKEKKKKNRPSNDSNMMHPRNSFQGSYDMERLCSYYPNLRSFLHKGHVSKANRPTINFSDPLAVRALNSALLAADYGIACWDDIMPVSCLCPPVPGRANYIHHIADVLRESARGGGGDTHSPLVDAKIRGVDVGTGASLIYPLIGTKTYGWSFIGTEISATSVRSAREIIVANELTKRIEVRIPQNKKHVLRNVLFLQDDDDDDEKVDFVMCNPPFYKSAKAFQKANTKKVRNLARHKRKRQGGDNDEEANVSSSTPEECTTPTRFQKGTKLGSDNFGGDPNELWCPGGEVAFISGLIEESRLFSDRCLWFSSLVSRQEHLPLLLNKLESTTSSRVVAGGGGSSSRIRDTRVIQMGGGRQKRSSLLFWSFHGKQEQQEWYRLRGNSC